MRTLGAVVFVLACTLSGAAQVAATVSPADELAQAHEELRRVSGTQLDAGIVGVLLEELGVSRRRYIERPLHAVRRPARGAASH